MNKKINNTLASLVLTGLLGLALLCTACVNNHDIATNDDVISKEPKEQKNLSPLEFDSNQNMASSELLSELQSIYGLVDLDSIELNYISQDNMVQGTFFFTSSVTAEQITTVQQLSYDKLHSGFLNQMFMREIDVWLMDILETEGSIQFDKTDIFIYAENNLILFERYENWAISERYENVSLILDGRVDESLSQQLDSFVKKEFGERYTAVVQKSLLSKALFIQINGTAKLKFSQYNALINFISDNRNLFTDEGKNWKHIILSIHDGTGNLYYEEVLEFDKEGLVQFDGEWTDLW